MNSLKRFMTARRISLGLILGVLALLCLSAIIPQQIDSSAEQIEVWRQGHRSLLWLVDGIRLHSIYAQPWFAALILFAAVALGISSWDQGITARKKLQATGTGGADELAASVDAGQLRRAAQAHGYRAVKTAAVDQIKYVKYPWGYFGNLLLHVGIALAITVSSYVALTGRQGSLVLVEGEQHDSSQPWLASEQGTLAAPLKLPGSIRLDKVRVSFDERNHPAGVSSDLTLTDPGGRASSLTASINKIEHYRGLRIYQASQYGKAFGVTLTGRDGKPRSEKIAVQQPTDLTEAGYSADLPLAGTRLTLSAKSYADADGKSMLSANPRVVLRLADGDRELARSALTRGQSGMLGEYRVRLDTVEMWAKLIIVDIKGMTAIFAGFAIIMLGGLIQYLTPPREIIGASEADGSYRVFWKATAFKECFEDERDQVAAALRKGMS
jgi:hypothetical protein